MNIFSKNKDFYLQSRSSKKKKITNFLEFILGCFLIAIAYNLFLVPNHFVPGGIGGLAIIINYFINIDNALVILVINLFLLIISYIFLGREKTTATILGTIISPIFIAATEPINVWLQLDTSKLLLSAIMGGIIFGIGLGLVFKGGYTTGGTDIINQILSKYLKISLGTSMLLSDGLIVLLSGIFFGVDIMLYSIMILYLISIMSDRIVLGISNNKMFYIISDKDEEIKSYIIKTLDHGVTIFKAKGGASDTKRNMIVTVLPTRNYYELRTNIKRIDKDAFFIITDSYEVFGGE